MMISILSIILVITLNLIPADITAFTVEVSDEHQMHFTKQADGGWNAIEPTKNQDLGMQFYVEGTKFTAKKGDEQHTQDFADILSIDEKVDWKKLTEFKLGEMPIKLKHMEEGLDFLIAPENQEKDAKTLQVRWDKEKTE